MGRKGWIGAAGRAGLVLALAAGIAACQSIYRNHGYVPTEQELAAVRLGDSREAVAQAIGRPSAEGLLNETGWYYVQSRYLHYGARTPKEVERQVVAISFSAGGTVQNVERFGLEKGQIVPLSRRVTESNIRGASFLRQLFGNIGRIRTDDLVD